LGGLLYGYDIGATSGATISLKVVPYHFCFTLSAHYNLQLVTIFSVHQIAVLCIQWHIMVQPVIGANWPRGNSLLYITSNFHSRLTEFALI
jgi:hypothetical protein